MLNHKISGTLLIVAVLAFAAGCSTAPASVVSTTGGQPANLSSSGGAGAVQPVTVLGQSAPVAGRSIIVVGTGKASGTPDIAHVNVGVETQADSVQQAVADNRGKMTQLLDALKTLGITDKDIQTTNYGVYTQREPTSDGKGGLGPTTYHVNNQVSVTVRDVGKLGDVLDKAVAAGANNIYGVNFSVADTSKLEAEARTKSIADAKARAESLAKLAGITLGDVIAISEVIGGSGPIYESPRLAASTGLGGGGAPIQPGELEVNMSVQVTFAIK